MLHLLPEEHKKKVLKEYRMRLGTTLAISAWVVAGIGVISLIPSYAVSKTRQSELKVQASVMQKDLAVLNADDLSQKVNDLSAKAAVLKPVGGVIVPTELFKRLRTHIGSIVVLNSFGYIRTDVNSSIDISGVARDRDALTRFIDELKKDHVFQGVDFPYASLSKQTNLDFTLHLVINEAEFVKAMNATTTTSI